MEDKVIPSNVMESIFRWIITLDHKKDDIKNYQAMTTVTNYIFFLGGRFRTVSNSKYLSIWVLALILLPLILFSIFETSNLWKNYNLRVCIILFYYFEIMCIIFFVKSSTGDPGILPKNVHLTDLHINHKIPSEYSNIITLPALGSKSKIEIKYCHTCKIWRPPRSYHCSICNTCILMQDHHCIWINNCIGGRNYRYFLTFLIASILASIFIFINSGFHLSKVSKISDAPVSLFLLLYSGLLIWYPLLLFISHILLTGTQQTTHEYLKSIGFKNPIFHKIKKIEYNPFNKKGFFSNMMSLACQARGLNVFVPKLEHEPGDWRFKTLPQ